MGLLDNNNKHQLMINGTIEADLSSTGKILSLDNIENNKCLMLCIGNMDGTPNLSCYGFNQVTECKLPMYNVANGNVVADYIKSKGLYAIDITGCSKVYIRNDAAVAELTSVSIMYSITNELPLFTSQRRPIQEIALLKGSTSPLTIYNLNTFDSKYIYVVMSSRNASGEKVAIDGYVSSYSPKNDVRKRIAEFSNKSEFISNWIENTPIAINDGFIATLTSDIPTGTTITIQIFGVR